MATMEAVDRRDGQSKVAAPPRRDRVLVVLIALVALVLAAFIGWTIGGSESEPVVHVIGGGELTERQEEMVRVADEFDAALRDGDGETLLALFASAFGEMQTTVDLLDMLNHGDGAVSPARFRASVHNAASGAFSIPRLAMR